MCSISIQRPGLLAFALLVVSCIFAPPHVSAQTVAPPEEKPSQLSDILRLERIPIAGGAELITVHARLDGLAEKSNDNWVPLVSILRDTLGDQNVENDRLRYVWPLTYTRPTVKQRFAAAIPFFYARVGNKETFSDKPPPALFDLAAPENEVWDKIFWSALQNLLFDPYGLAIKASTSSYRQNTGDYKKAHIIRALSVLALYQAVKGESAFTDAEMAEIQARLLLTDKTFGGLVDEANLQTYYARKTATIRDERGHNWELLRQRAEAEQLYFEPLQMPDGSATHALLWVAKRDLAKRQDARYHGRFLNIADPWSDKRLLNWQGYTDMRYFDHEGREVPKDTPGTEAVEMIPLALYGLDYPKIPTLLVDFRDGYNPKKREMSRRVLHDVTRNVLSVSKFGNLPYFLGRTVYDFVTGRRGIDLNQPTRLQTYSQLKLLLSLNDSLEPKLRNEINVRLEKVSLNPFENDFEAEAKVARAQYAALVNFAKEPNGLAAKLERDRRSEMLPLEHGRAAQIAFRVANVISFGTYVHREQLTDNMEDRLATARQLQYHTKFLEQVARAKGEIDMAWDLAEIKRSLRFVADHGAGANGQAVSAAAKIFARTKDDETRRACLDSLSRISNPKAKTELLRISQNQELNQTWREIAQSYLTGKDDRVQPIAVTITNSPPKAGQP
jgi:hypothetical protein